MRTVPPSSHGTQRVKVGAIGLAVVILLFVVASAILGAASRDKPVAAPGGAKSDIVANIAGSNEAAASAALSDMGIAPGVANTATATH